MMELNISISGEELNSKLAAKQLHLIAEMVKSGDIHAEGFNIGYVGEYNLDVEYTEEAYPHGDYQDTEGNLLHVSHGTVVNVTWANKNAEIEEVEIAVDAWIADHGEITPAGHGEGEHEH